MGQEHSRRSRYMQFAEALSGHKQARYRSTFSAVTLTGKRHSQSMNIFRAEALTQRISADGKRAISERNTHGAEHYKRMHSTHIVYEHC
jgi:hypothetical protein